MVLRVSFCRQGDREGEYVTGDHFDKVIRSPADRDGSGSAVCLIGLLEIKRVASRMGKFECSRSTTGGNDYIVRVQIAEIFLTESCSTVSYKGGAHGSFVRPDGEFARMWQAIEEVGSFPASVTHIFEIDEIGFGEQSGGVGKIERLYLYDTHERNKEEEEHCAQG